jgi:hypothetical protein
VLLLFHQKVGIVLAVLLDVLVAQRLIPGLAGRKVVPVPTGTVPIRAGVVAYILSISLSTTEEEGDAVVGASDHERAARGAKTLCTTAAESVAGNYCLNLRRFAFDQVDKTLKLRAQQIWSSVQALGKHLRPNDVRVSSRKLPNLVLEDGTVNDGDSWRHAL